LLEKNQFSEAARLILNSEHVIPDGHPWKEKAAEYRQICARRAESIQSHPMPRTMTRSREGLEVQRVIKNLLIAQNLQKKRLNEENAKKKALVEEGIFDETNDSLWKIQPSEEELQGLLVRESEKSVAVTEFVRVAQTLLSGKRSSPSKNFLSVREVAVEKLLKSSPSISNQSSGDASGNALLSPKSLPETIPEDKSRVSCRSIRTSQQTGLSRKLANSLMKASMMYIGSASTIDLQAPLIPSGAADDSKIDSHSVLSEHEILLQSATIDFALLESLDYTRIENMVRETRLYESLVMGLTERIKWLKERVDVMKKMKDVQDLSKEIFQMEFPLKATQNSVEKNCGSEAGEKQLADKVSGIKLCPNQASELHTGNQDVRSLLRKQRLLRSLLPSLDHHSEAYRMITCELSENEKVLKSQRDEKLLREIMGQTCAEGKTDNLLENNRKFCPEATFLLEIICFYSLFSICFSKIPESRKKK
jgi:hypothetical protein